MIRQRAVATWRSFDIACNEKYHVQKPREKQENSLAVYLIYESHSG